MQENFIFERNKRWHKQLEGYTMFLDWNNQYCENYQSNLQIQCHPYQIINGIFNRIRAKIFTLCMETQKTPNSQKAVLRERNRAGGIRLPNFRLYYKTTSIKAIWDWPKKQKYRSMDQGRTSTGKPTHLWPPSLWQRRRDYSVGKAVSSVSAAGKPGQPACREFIFCAQCAHFSTSVDTINFFLHSDWAVQHSVIRFFCMLTSNSLLYFDLYSKQSKRILLTGSAFPPVPKPASLVHGKWPTGSYGRSFRVRVVFLVLQRRLGLLVSTPPGACSLRMVHFFTPAITYLRNATSKASFPSPTL